MYLATISTENWIRMNSGRWRKSVRFGWDMFGVHSFCSNELRNSSLLTLKNGFSSISCSSRFITHRDVRSKEYPR
ncbi:hypothetical protein Y032_0173g422 [Ancylostoma ceylanicum]|uniref:Uncharacterized protein n=1 Tax=Ancylostoma ceylanicum TaxID=53326 RepID=A0A016SUC1_9BILA|nr:hypothetical protein Y032_0173g422 [Ancylostoma ceylanicum]